MKFRDYINEEYLIKELFDTNIDVHVVKKSRNNFKCEFFIDALKYIFIAVPDKKDIWEIFFGIEPKKDKWLTNMNITGTGNATKVFSAVLKCLKIFIKYIKPKQFYFGAEETSRKKLYDRFAKVIHKILPYKLIKTEIEKSDSEYDDYIGYDDYGMDIDRKDYYFQKK